MSGMKSTRSKVNHEQKKVANKMLARAGASLQKIVVDDVVAIPVPAVDRAKVDSNLLLCWVYAG